MLKDRHRGLSCSLTICRLVHHRLNELMAEVYAYVKVLLFKSVTKTATRVGQFCEENVQIHEHNGVQTLEIRTSTSLLNLLVLH